MSKLPSKAPVNSSLQTFQKPSMAPVERMAGSEVPAVREVRPLPMTRGEQNSLIVAYKDLNSDVELELKKQKQQMVFAFMLFAFFGVLILMAQVLTKPRARATASDGTLIEGTPTKIERYHYDKTCVRTETGEEICNTRESRSRM